MCALTIGVPGLWCYSYSGTVWKRCQYKLDPGLWFYRKVSFGMVVAWDTINFHSLLNQVQLNENKHQNLENNCHFGTLFWHRDCWSKTSRWNRKISHWSLFGGPSNMSYQLSISECCCASLYGKLYIKMLEASNDPILEFSAAGGYTFNFKEREREIWSILTPITRVNTRSAQAKTLYKIDELVSIWVSFKPELSILESCGPRCLAVQKVARMFGACTDQILEFRGPGGGKHM